MDLNVAADPLEIVNVCKTILLVEDEEFVRSVTQEVLEMEGFHVLGAANAREAIELSGRDGDPIDLLLADVVMPGMNGKELAARSVKTLPHLKVIFMSGYSDNAVLKNLAEVSSFYLQKPFTLDALLAKIQEAFATSESPVAMVAAAGDGLQLQR